MNNTHSLVNYHAPAFVCSHIFKNSHPILLVIKEDGDWQFLCGGEHNENELPRVIGIGHLLNRDKTLLNLLKIKNEWEAERFSIEEDWIITQFRMEK